MLSIQGCIEVVHYVETYEPLHGRMNVYKEPVIDGSLVGCPPFWHRKQMYMLRSIMEGRYSFHSPEWDDISDLPKDLISKLLVVEPSQRLTAAESLEHPFFKREEVPLLPTPYLPKHVVESLPEREETRTFYPKRMFKAAALVIIASNRIKRLHLNPPPIHIDQARSDPYSQKIFRKIIDAGAFKIYGHWVKRGENQNRAALFENAPKRDIKISSER